MRSILSSILSIVFAGIIFTNAPMIHPYHDVAPAAHGGSGNMEDWYFATPFLARGNFVFVQRVSRRILREYVEAMRNRHNELIGI